MKTTQLIKSIALTSLALIFGACASGKRLSATDRASIHSVSVQQQITLPTKPPAYSYMDLTSGVGSDLAAGGGLLWLAINAATAHSSASSGQILLTDSQANNFPIETVVRNAFTQQLQRSAVFPLSATGIADAAFKLKVPQYGLAHEGLVRKIIPFVSIKAELAKSDGKPVFISIKSVRSAPEFHRTFEEYHANPQLLRIGWEDAARKASDALIEELRH